MNAQRLHVLSFAALALVALSVGGLLADDVRPPLKLEPKEFARYFSQFVDKGVSAIIHTGRPTKSQYGTRAFTIKRLSEPTEPYEKNNAEVLVFEGTTLRHRLRLTGFKTLAADWVTDEVLKLTIWPGRAIELIELIDVRSSKVLFQTANNHIYATTQEQK